MLETQNTYGIRLEGDAAGLESSIILEAFPGIYKIRMELI